MGFGMSNQPAKLERNNSLSMARNLQWQHGRTCLPGREELPNDAHSLLEVWITAQQRACVLTYLRANLAEPSVLLISSVRHDARVRRRC